MFMELFLVYIFIFNCSCKNYYSSELSAFMVDIRPYAVLCVTEKFPFKKVVPQGILPKVFPFALDSFHRSIKSLPFISRKAKSWKIFLLQKLGVPRETRSTKKKFRPKISVDIPEKVILGKGRQKDKSSKCYNM